MEEWQLIGESGPCACSQLRRTARKVSALYDAALQPAGLTVTQYALLVNVARAGRIGRSALAAQLGMERTTLTRNLAPLEKLGLIAAAPSSDGRARLLQVSPAGRRKLRQSYALWEKAQTVFAARLGPRALQQFRTILQAAENAAAPAT